MAEEVNNIQNTYNQQPIVGNGQIMPPPMKMRRSGERLSGEINTYFPNKMAQTAVVAYIVALIGISLVYNTYAMTWYWWVFGIVGVLGFFLLSSFYGKKWGTAKPRAFKKNMFKMALAIRIVVIFILYFFFDAMNGRPFMFESADEQFYHDIAGWVADCIRNDETAKIGIWIKEGVDISDSGFPLYLSVVYWISDNSIIVARLLNCLWSALTCILLYNLGRRNFGEAAGRMVGIFFMLETHYIIYCGLHLKETLMVFLLVLFLERADNLLRSRNFKILEVAPILLVLLSLFLFRTILGISAGVGLAMALLFSSQKVASLGRRWLLLIAVGFAASLFVGGRIMSEMETLWQQKDSNQETRMEVIQKTQSFAKYATKTVLAPMIFTIPFPTMVETEGQENHRMMHAGFVVKNVMSFFCMMALFLLLINPKADGWRNNVLLGAFLVSYLFILVQSAFVHADRFHLPAYVVELLFAAYGVQQMSKPKHKRWFTYWCMLMVVAWFVWSWFKLAGRGL